MRGAHHQGKIGLERRQVIGVEASEHGPPGVGGDGLDPVVCADEQIGQLATVGDLDQPAQCLVPDVSVAVETEQSEQGGRRFSSPITSPTRAGVNWIHGSEMYHSSGSAYAFTESKELTGRHRVQQVLDRPGGGGPDPRR